MRKLLPRFALLAGLLSAVGLSTGCHDDDCEIRQTRVYRTTVYEPAVYGPVYSGPPPVVHQRRVIVRRGYGPGPRGYHGHRGYRDCD